MTSYTGADLRGVVESERCNNGLANLISTFTDAELELVMASVHAVAHRRKTRGPLTSLDLEVSP
jgi:hypothetical protein